MRFRFLFITAIITLTFLSSCDDQGDPVSGNQTNTEVKFSSDIQPLLSSKGCAGCHGNNGGLSVASVASLLTGGLHGPAIVPGKADSSIIILKLRGTASFGARMPQGGTPLSTAEIKVFEDWINQGAKNN